MESFGESLLRDLMVWRYNYETDGRFGTGKFGWPLPIGEAVPLPVHKMQFIVSAFERIVPAVGLRCTNL